MLPSACFHIDYVDAGWFGVSTSTMLNLVSTPFEWLCLIGHAAHGGPDRVRDSLKACITLTVSVTVISQKCLACQAMNINQGALKDCRDIRPRFTPWMAWGWMAETRDVVISKWCNMAISSFSGVGSLWRWWMVQTVRYDALVSTPPTPRTVIPVPQALVPGMEPPTPTCTVQVMHNTFGFPFLFFC